METLTIKVNTRTNRGKQLVNLINEMEKEGSVKIEKSTYNPEFVAAVLKSRASKGKAIKTEDLWK